MLWPTLIYANVQKIQNAKYGDLFGCFTSLEIKCLHRLLCFNIWSLGKLALEVVGPLRGGTLQEEEISGELGFKIFIADPPHMFPMCQDVNKQLPKTLPT